MGVPDSLTRTKVPIVPAERDDSDDGDDPEIRVYFSRTDNSPPMPSVSVIKGLRVDPEKDEALAGWRDRYDGQSQWARPWWKDQQMFKGYRGTLVHFTILSALGDASGDTYYHRVGDSDWGPEEYYAEYALKKWSKHAPSATSKAVPYTPRDNKYDGEHAWDKATRGMKWAARAFKRAIIEGESPPEATVHGDSVPLDGRLDPANVLGVEEYVYDTEYGYGGQYDLLYETPDGRIVLSDLKTSSAVRFDHKLQSAAYKRAVERQRGITVDECEVLRLHPDSETVEVSRSPQWNRTLDGLEHEFLALADRAWSEDYSETLERAEVQLLDERDATEQSTLES